MEKKHRISRLEDGKIVLDPQVEIPPRDHWLYKNPEALASLMEGFNDTREGRIVDLGIDFSQILDDGKG